MFSYYGAKNYIAPWVVSHFPARLTYVDAFGGSGKMTFAQKTEREIFNELNPEIFNLFRVAKDFGSRLMRVLWSIQTDRPTFKYWLDHVPLNDVEQAARTFFRYQMSFNGRGQQYAEDKARSITRMRNQEASGWLQARIELEQTYIPRLQKVDLRNLDALEVIAEFDSPDTLLYLDPPYVGSTRKGKGYELEYTDKQHEKLLTNVVQCRSKVCISGYDCSLYRYHLRTWNLDIKDFDCAAGQGRRVEVLWMNY